MFHLFESIYLNNGTFRNLSYHQARIEKGITDLFGESPKWRLEEVIHQIKYPKTGLFKMRVVYASEILNIEFSDYQPKIVKSLKLVAGSLDYTYKYENRSELNSLFQQRGTCDEIIIVKDGFITDSSYANLIFRKQNEWFTPVTFLLAGTMRNFLLDQKVIKAASIRPEDLHQFNACKLINAMLGMDAPEIPISAIS
jgi:4-amino-4-deoxychorismate lyase